MKSKTKFNWLIKLVLRFKWGKIGEIRFQKKKILILIGSFKIVLKSDDRSRAIVYLQNH